MLLGKKSGVKMGPERGLCGSDMTVGSKERDEDASHTTASGCYLLTGYWGGHARW